MSSVSGLMMFHPPSLAGSSSLDFAMPLLVKLHSSFAFVFGEINFSLIWATVDHFESFNSSLDWN